MSRVYALVKITLVTSHRLQGTMTIPSYQFRDSLNFMHRKNARIMLLKILTHSMAGCVTFCFDGLFVKCFQNGDHSVLNTYQYLNELLL